MPEAVSSTDRMAELGQQLRVDAVRACAEAGSGHATSSMSAADLMAVLLAKHLRYDFDAPEDPGNDELIFSKGHASPLLYAMFTAAGAISEDELLTFRSDGSRLEGHPTPRLPWVEVATGSLGQGLPLGVGFALVTARLETTGSRVWVLCGDSELAEGSVWEAFEHAGTSGLDNLTAIVDVNRLGQRGPTRHGWDVDAYSRRIRAFGWNVIEVEGHDPDQIDRAFATATGTTGMPTAIVARTSKGKGVAAVEDQEGAHGKPLPDTEEAIRELGGRRSMRVRVARPESLRRGSPRRSEPKLPGYEVGAEAATRTAFGEALTALGHARSDVVVLDGEVSDSTRSGYFAEEHPERFVQCYIAEQQLVAAAVGLQARGWVPYLATFAAFLTRAHDFLRMAAVSGANLRVVGSHAGVSIGKDGPSQMGLEDLAMFRAVAGSAVLHPCDANQAAQLTAGMADLDGISYLRATRGNTPVIYGPEETFPVGGSRVLRSSPEDQITLVAAGVTVPEALRAADRLAEAGIPARVIDLYSIKPVDTATLRTAAEETGRLLTVEDHWPQGGLGAAVLEAFAGGPPPPRYTTLAVRAMPASATPEEQLRHAGIDAEAIADAARALAAS
ncbi:transketolase [Amycolatopsis cihanbeyliensis]|uniref:Transketolase n=1 Tax=Amycolatopsis cihanbeyliensis TaxID=1128664 RepID=A0A542DD34_AMYCI|nr:transketolase [Amycolatopsis cihanbeyliensis]TQJ00981.1 transketolase [Amycolatopsis cihanbeyliensis]